MSVTCLTYSFKYDNIYFSGWDYQRILDNDRMAYACDENITILLDDNI